MTMKTIVAPRYRVDCDGCDTKEATSATESAAWYAADDAGYQTDGTRYYCDNCWRYCRPCDGNGSTQGPTLGTPAKCPDCDGNGWVPEPTAEGGHSNA